MNRKFSSPFEIFESLTSLSLRDFQFLWTLKCKRIFQPPRTSYGFLSSPPFSFYLGRPVLFLICTIKSDRHVVFSQYSECFDISPVLFPIGLFPLERLKLLFAQTTTKTFFFFYRGVTPIGRPFFPCILFNAGFFPTPHLIFIFRPTIHNGRPKNLFDRGAVRGLENVGTLSPPLNYILFFF